MKNVNLIVYHVATNAIRNYVRTVNIVLKIAGDFLKIIIKYVICVIVFVQNVINNQSTITQNAILVEKQVSILINIKANCIT